MSDVRLPNNTQRTVLVGRTGSGKTRAGVWHLSNKVFSEFPWVIFDTKRDSFLKKIYRFPGVKKITFSDKISKPGLYYIQPLPEEMQEAQAEDFLWYLHKRGGVGIYIDEGYMMHRYSKALNALYTQGRDLRIPMITLSQKPKYLTPFTFSEADFFQVFQLNDQNDRKRITEFMPADLNRRLPNYHSLWYDVGQDQVVEFRPVPADDQILENIRTQFVQKTRVL